MKTKPISPLWRGVAALCCFGLALMAYWSTARYFDHTGSPGTAYFNHLAAAFLRGQLYLPSPPETLDLTFHAGQWYVPFPPLPALLMVPWVAGFGLSAIDTTFFCALFGALNVTFIFLLLTTLADRPQIQLSRQGVLWLTLLFGLGTVHWYMATIGSVWFVAQICTVTFVALAAWSAAFRGSPWLTGTALALAMLARPTVLLTWPLLFGLVFSQQSPEDEPRVSWRAMVRWTWQSAILPVIAIVALLYYNYARFGNPLDFGYLTENVADVLAPKLAQYGQFNLRYLPKNFWAMWLAGPEWNERTNFWQPNPEGMSLLLTTPALIYLVRARGRSFLIWGGWLSIILLMTPLLLYYNTGWWQFGYRFSLDFMVPVMVLLALTIRERVTWPMRVLIIAGIVVNAYGVYWWHG